MPGERIKGDHPAFLEIEKASCLNQLKRYDPIFGLLEERPIRLCCTFCRSPAGAYGMDELKRMWRRCVRLATVQMAA